MENIWEIYSPRGAKFRKKERMTSRATSRVQDASNKKEFLQSEFKKGISRKNLARKRTAEDLSRQACSDRQTTRLENTDSVSYDMPTTLIING